MRISKPTLGRYIAWRLFPVLAILAVLWAVFSQTSYFYALDETAHFYIFDDGVRFSGTDIELNDGFRNVAHDFNKLPLSIRSQISPEELEPNLVYFIETNQHDIYFLAYQSDIEVPLVYISHHFEKSDSVDLFPVILMALVLSFIVLFLAVSYLVWRVKQQSRLFLNATRQLSDETDTSGSPNLAIDELATAYQNLYIAKQTQIAVNQRERSYSGFLSHEVRQPVTHIGHVLARISQQDELPLSLLPLLDDLALSQQRMSMMSDTILDLWQAEQGEYQHKSLNLVDYLKSWQATKLAINLECNVNNVSSFISEHHLNLLLDQIEKNFQQYGDDQLTVSLTQNQLRFSNHVAQKIEDDGDYGWGVGTFILTAVAKRAGWNIEVEHNDRQYSVKFSF